MSIPRQAQRQYDAAMENFKQGQGSSGEPGASQPTVHNPGNVVHNPDLRSNAAPEPGQTAPPSTPEQQRIATLQGMLRAEAEKAQRTAQDNARLNKVVEDLSGLVSALQAQVSTLQQARPSNGNGGDGDEEAFSSPKKADSGLLDLEKFDGYGEEMTEAISMINRLAEENKQLRETYGNVGQQVQNLSQGVVTERFYGALNAGAPDWQAINARQDWRSWLTAPENRPRAGEVMGDIRDNILQAAFQRGDGRRVVQMINDWKTDMGLTGQNIAPERSASYSLEDQVMPEANVGGDGSFYNQGPGKKVTAEEYNKAAKDLSIGKITEEQYLKVLKGFQQSFKGGGANAPANY